MYKRKYMQISIRTFIYLPLFFLNYLPCLSPIFVFNLFISTHVIILIKHVMTHFSHSSLRILFLFCLYITKLQAQKVLQKSEQQGRNEFTIDYDEMNPFK